MLVVHWNKPGIGICSGYHLLRLRSRAERALAEILSSFHTDTPARIMSARQPFRPTPRPDSQLSSSQSESSKVFHSQRVDTDLGNAANKSFNLSGLFNPKKRDQSLPTRKSKSHESHQAPPQNISNNSWSASPHTSKLDLSRAPSPVLSSTTSGLGSVSTYQNSGITSAQIEDIPSSPIADNGSVTSSFFTQETNPQHLLPMINEADEAAELVDAPTENSASFFFAGRYTDGLGPRKRAQRTGDDVDNMDNVNAKRFKSEQVGSRPLVSMWMPVTLGINSMLRGPRPTDHAHLPTYMLHPRNNSGRNNMSWILYWGSTRMHISARI